MRISDWSSDVCSSDLQLAVLGKPRSRWMRLLAREDLRHLLKHKRTSCPQSITPVERRILKRTSWLREAWFATGKPVYRFVTRRMLKWEDNEGQGPKPGRERKCGVEGESVEGRVDLGGARSIK